MRYVTRCPACLALFEVRDAQRRAAQGWLRCGQCLTAFDSAGLVLPWPEMPLAVPVQASGMADVERLDLDTLLHHRDASPIPVSTPGSVAVSAASPALVQPQTTVMPGPVDSALAAPMPYARPVPVPSPVGARRQAVVSPNRPWLWLVASLVALVMGAFQLFYAYRGPLAMQTPVIEQLGHAGCRVLGCDWPVLHDSRALRLEHARLLRQGDVLVLSMGLRNLAPVTVSSGRLAVTLRDSKGQPMVRRFVPMAMLGGPSILPPRGLWEGQAQLLFASPDDIAGFQVILAGP